MVVVRRLQAIVEADGVIDFESKIGSATQALSAFRKGAGLTGAALGVLGATGFAVAVNEARKFEQAMVEVEKVTNPQTADAMAQSIKNMAETIPLAQKELAQIAADAGRFGIEGPKAISKFTRATAKMATATNLNAQQAGEAFARLATLTDTPISKVENLGSSINKLSNNFATSAQEIVDSMLRASGVMTQFGLRQTDIAAFSATLNEVSESSERAGTRLRRLFQELSNPKKIGKVANALGLTVQEFKRMKKNNPRQLLLQMIKGFKRGEKTANGLKKSLSTTSRQALAGLSQNLKGLRESLGMSRKAFKRNTSLQKEFRAASKTLNSQLKLLLNRVRNVALSLGSKLLPHVTNLVKGINRAVARFQRFNQRLDGIVTPSILAAMVITGIGTAIYYLAGAISAAAIVGFATGLGMVLVAVTALSAGIIALWQAWKKNMFNIQGRTKKAVAFLKGAFRNFMNFLGTLRTTVTKIFNKIRTAVQVAANRIRTAWINRVVPLINQTRKTFNQIKTAIQSALTFIQNNVIRPVLNWIQTQWNKHGTVIMAEVRKTTNFLRRQFNKVVSEIRKTIQPFVNWATSTWNTFMNRLRHDARMIWNGIKSVVRGVLNTISGIIRTVLSTIQRLWNQNGEQIISIVKFAFDTIKGTIEFYINAARTIIVSVLRLMRGDVDGAMQEIDRFITSTFNGITSFLDRWGGKLISWATGTFNAAKRDVVGAIRGMKRDVTNAVDSMLSAMKRAARGFIDGFTQPFEDAKERVLDKFNELKNKVVGNSIVPDMLGMIMDETGDWKTAFQANFEGAADGSQAAMEQMPSELGLPTPGRGRRARGTDVTNNRITIDVTVPKGVDTDTAARTIADEVRSQGFD